MAPYPTRGQALLRSGLLKVETKKELKNFLWTFPGRSLSPRSTLGATSSSPAPFREAHGWHVSPAVLMQVEAALHQRLDCGCQCSSSTTEMEAARKKRDSLPYVPLIVLWPEGAKRHIASGGPGCEGHITNERYISVLSYS